MDADEPPKQKRPKLKLSVERGKGNEAKRVTQRLVGFDLETCTAFRAIREIFSAGVTHNELKSVAYVLCSNVPGLKLDRDATRDNRVLIKWYDENWDVIKDEIRFVALRDERERVIDRTSDHPLPV